MVSCSVVVEPSEVNTIAAAIRAAPIAAFDFEFLTQDRLIPTLCLVQVAWVDVALDAGAGAIVAAEPEIRLIDPLAVDAGPVLEALAGHACAIVHAGRQDIAIAAQQFGVELAGAIDTQVMAAFAGVGDQVGLGAVANETLGVSLVKEQQWTDWSRRPLSAAQLAYAAADVRHLPGIYARLAARLGPRLAWAREESAGLAAAAIAAVRVTPEDAWEAVGGLRGLPAAGFAVGRELAAWRLRLATELDKPIGWVLTDKQIVELARARPAKVEAVKGVKGLPAVARQRAEEIAEVVARAIDGAGDERLPAPRPPSQRAQRWADLLLAIAQVVADETGVAVRMLATRADAEAVARAVDEGGGGIEAARGLPAFATWRREVLGEPWERWLEGNAVLVADRGAASGVALKGQ